MGKQFTKNIANLPFWDEVVEKSTPIWLICVLLPNAKTNHLPNRIHCHDGLLNVGGGLGHRCPPPPLDVIGITMGTQNPADNQ